MNVIPEIEEEPASLEKKFDDNLNFKALSNLKKLDQMHL